MALTQVKSDGIATGAVTATQIAANAVTVDDISDGSISTAKLADSAVTNAKVDASAAIAGTKISPDFGSQNVVTTGTLEAGVSTVDRIINATTSADPWLKGVNSSNTETSFITKAGRGFLNELGIGTKTPIGPLEINMGTDKNIAFQGGIGEIGSVPGFQGVNDAANALTSIGMRGTDIRFACGSSERLRITSDGTLQLRNSPGIDFSQIQTNASGMDSETLDSYEVGTWTPTISFGTTTISASGYNMTGAGYVKIGHLVHVGASITSIEKGSATGELRIGGLPFSVENSYSLTGDSTGVCRWQGIGTTSGTLSAYFNQGTSYLILQKFNATTGYYGSVNNNDCNTSINLYFVGGWYYADR